LIHVPLDYQLVNKKLKKYLRFFQINFEKKFCEIKKGYTFTMFKGLGF